MKKLKLFIILISIICLSIASVGCEGNISTYSKFAKNLSFNYSQVSNYGVGDEFFINVEDINVVPSNYAYGITFESENSKIATVSDLGLIKCVGVGTTKIYAFALMSKNLYTTTYFELVVDERPTYASNILILSNNITLNLGEEISIDENVSILPSNCKSDINVNIDNTNVISFNRETNKLLAKSTGNANITVAINSGEGFLDVIIKSFCISVGLNNIIAPNIAESVLENNDGENIANIEENTKPNSEPENEGAEPNGEPKEDLDNNTENPINETPEIINEYSIIGSIRIDDKVEVINDNCVTVKLSSFPIFEFKILDEKGAIFSGNFGISIVDAFGVINNSNIISLSRNSFYNSLLITPNAVGETFIKIVDLQNKNNELIIKIIIVF